MGFVDINNSEIAFRLRFTPKGSEKFFENGINELKYIKFSDYGINYTLNNLPNGILDIGGCHLETTTLDTCEHSKHKNIR
jgi:hypothetical protein